MSVRERESECERERECVCVREREIVCVIVLGGIPVHTEYRCLFFL